LKQIEFQKFWFYHLRAVIPSVVLFVAQDVHSHLSQLSLSDRDSCPAFRRWLLLRESEIAVDFHRIVTSDSDLPQAQNIAPDLVEFEGSPVIVGSDGSPTRIYRRRMEGALAVVKSLAFSPWIERCQIETEIENVLNLRHPLIAPLAGSVLPVESNGLWELKTVRLPAAGGRRERRRNRLWALRMASDCCTRR
jgi:hypothetical protein